jgi:hypothetical protein
MTDTEAVAAATLPPDIVLVDNNSSSSTNTDENNSTAASSNTISALDLARGGGGGVGQNDELLSSSFSATNLPTTNNLSTQSINSGGTGNEITNSYELELTRLREIIKEKDAELVKLEARLNETETTARMQSEQLNKQFSVKLEESIRSLKESSQKV